MRCASRQGRLSNHCDLDGLKSHRTDLAHRKFGVVWSVDLQLRGAKKDKRGTGYAHHCACLIPAIRPDAFDCPEPGERGGDVDAALDRVCTTGSGNVNLRKQPGEHGQAGHACGQPEGGAVSK